MIRIVLLSSALFLLVYSVVIKVWSPAAIAQHHWQKNAIKAQDFIYESHSDSIRSIIVGSSLSACIFMDSLEGFSNLSFTGQGILDGLEIVRRMEHPPRTVFIETNKLFRKEESAFTATLFNPVWHPLRRVNPAFREGRQPLALAGDYLARLMGKKEFRLTDNEVLIDSAQDETLRSLLESNRMVYEQGPDPKDLRDCIASLQQRVAALREKGVKVVFFEMPVHKMLADLNEANQVRKAFAAVFPPEEYERIPQPDCEPYRTFDGMHLTATDARRYTSYFKERALQL